jgi:hypothetical protein
MLHKLRWLAWFFALVAIATLCDSRALASVQFNVGQFDLNESPVPFSASWLHDASSSPSASASSPGSSDNRAYRMGDTSSPLVGSFFGDFSQSLNQVTNIRGTLSGNSTHYLLHNFNSSMNSQKFILKLGQDAGAGKGGKLAFETEGPVPGGQYTGGYIDYVLAVDSDPAVDVVNYTDVLAGTFFFKPQGENSSSMLSPNRGTVSQFTLWGYNYLHDSYAYDGGNVDWTAFFATLGGYSGNVKRPDIVGDPSAGLPLNQTLGISLYVTSDQGHMPEPTAFIVWGMLTMVAASLSGRNR